MKSFRLLFLVLCPVLFFSCAKEKSLERGSGNNVTSEWEFSEGSNFFKGKMDTAFVEEFGGVNVLFMEGTSDDGTGFLNISVSNIDLSAPGTYKTPLVLFDYSKSAGVVYENDIAAINEFTIEITSINSNSVSGTFTGKVLDGQNASKTITSGKFSAKLGSSVTPPAGTGQVSFWSKNSCSGGPISVKLNNETKLISSFTQSAPADCNVAGNANFTVPPGTYTWEAICNSDTLRGTVLVAVNGCTKAELSFATGPAAQFLFVASGGNCSSLQINGTYIAGKVLGDTNYVVVQVNVTTIGAYNISTNSMNGFSFSASGHFANTGIQPVTLRASGTPQNASPTSFTVSGSASSCSFIIPVINAPAGSDINTWSFTQGSKTFSGTFSDGGFFGDNQFGAGKALDMFGEIPNTDTLFLLFIEFPASATQPVPGTYITDPDFFSAATTDFIMYDDAAGVEVFAAKSLTGAGQNVKMTIVISSYDPATKVVRGTFSGKSFTASGSVVDITNGKFAAEVSF
ncbi:MAG TPA: hypothetical protein VD996_09390 [Chitinophagaceae bacterium]|nr:hypothetical protein [Chitinophagaceae bacterium]